MPAQTKTAPKIRNLAIIAHVDHGKTTLVDHMLKQSKVFRDNQAEMRQELILDSGDQERERGITITAKVTAVEYGDYRLNIIDTPGHADFSGEVERTLNMADGCLLIVDAQEGPMPQTKFVLRKALQSGLKPIVVINKIDKAASRIEEVEHELADLFLELAIDDDQLHYPEFYAIGREGKAWAQAPADPTEPADLAPLFAAIVEYIPPPDVEADGPLQMLVTALAWDNFKGKYSIGRVTRGSVKAGDRVAVVKRDGSIEQGRVAEVYMSHGLNRFVVETGTAGDIVQLTGLAGAQIGETIADADAPEALPTIEVEAPTLRIYLGPNTSPFKGTEGEFTTNRQIAERLRKELETNVGLRVEQHDKGFLVSGRGELHLSVLIETMRREGFELEVGRPQVVTTEIDGATFEPVEEVVIEVPDEHAGAVQTEFGQRRAMLKGQHAVSGGLTRLTYEIPTRTLLGVRGILMTTTKGTAVMNSLHSGYQPIGLALEQQRNGALIAFEAGTSTPFALQNAEERGTVFIGPTEKVYQGQIIGLNSRSDDLEINVCKTKHLTNMRSKSSDGVVQLTPPTVFSLEQNMDFLENDELLEVTPKSMRLRKRQLVPHLRKREKERAKV
ncbi:MAG: translational GTPase TypA [Thermoleophilia bacterium]|nr:translational GTPase TypA [Thermoleophilia bacterium]